MVEYTVAIGDTSTELADEVTRLMRDGYQPIGGVSVAGVYRSWTNERKGCDESETAYTFAQAMLRMSCPAPQGTEK